MNALIVLIPVSLLLIACAIGLFFWAVRRDQFRNLDAPEILPLLDAEPDVADPSRTESDDELSS